jgi:hypothetical protein
MMFAYAGEAMPSFEIPVDQAEETYPKIFAQLSERRIAQYEAARAAFAQHGSCL